ncbi:sugar transferase [Pseudooctadecabacter jejudonensis]|uniref:UDP-N-acetylgalactosamine-undecaprenyl-phosphate N-acetylgalactosaminephosphotransferase n=1 Tax=Pseudooctadecabacter jejudonensis TaxID=1391910 RepID=A0A1Y5S992_9RHOB|nr:sugar transferase [Pseudooctadecabacter jejudonensis]SLN35359.1 UDP-N-acetylgalactosamine-undecaprenyl-phosphate N-acetylgalactosaminephosphotransferase [Pseudooctadecabacter jejudonensis]
MKRLFDIVCAALILTLFAPAMIVIAVLIKRSDRGPVFYIAERMRTPSQSFALIKFRTMTVVDAAENAGVTGADKTGRITPIGRTLRRFRLDELPQAINVLRGDMSMVGPRPPLRQYTDAFPDLYGRVLRCRPGITGLATLYFHRHEERLIAAASSAEETERIYVRRCIPRKATLDLIYARQASVCFDVVILWRTLMRVLGR